MICTKKSNKLLLFLSKAFHSIVNHAGFDDVEKNLLDHLIMIVIIKKGENMNHAGFDDAEKNSLDNDCHH